MTKLEKIKKSAKEFWQDNSGFSITMETVGYAIAAISAAGILAGVGISAAKNKAGNVAGDLGNFKVNGPTTVSPDSTASDATISNGNSTITSVTIND